MNVREMHIEVNQSLQKVGAHRTRKFEPEEIDLVLNKMVSRFIQGKVRARGTTGGFELDQLGTDALRPLIVQKDLPAYIGSGKYVCHLPPDYTHLLEDSSMVVELCGKKAESETEILTVVQLRQDKSPKTAPKFYTTASIVLGGKTVSIPGSLPYSNEYDGYFDKKDISFLTPFILSTLNDSGIEVHWEKFGGINASSCYLCVGVGIPTAASMVIDGFTATQTSFTTLTLSKHKGEGVRSANRLTNSGQVGNMLKTAFYTTSGKSPMSELFGNNLYIYRDNSFTVSRVMITYLKKPQIISLLLGTDCDLATDFHPAICDLAVEYLKGTLENAQGVALKASDNERRVVL